LTRRPKLTLATSSSSNKAPPRGFVEQSEPDDEQAPPIQQTSPAEHAPANRGQAVSRRSGSLSPATVATTVILFGLAVVSIVLLKRRLF
jgi:hypothetical protein